MAKHLQLPFRCLFVFLLVGLAGGASADQCDNPTSVFSSPLKRELRLLEKAYEDRGFLEADVAKAMDRRMRNLCIDLSTKAIDIEQAVEHTKLARYTVALCERADSSAPSAHAKAFASESKLGSRRVLLAVEKFCSKASSSTKFEERYSGILELDSEIFCIHAEPPEILTLRIADFPPIARVSSIGKTLCQRLKKREISLQDARYELQAARLKELERFGDSKLMFSATAIVWTSGRFVSEEHPYYWGIMNVTGLALLAIFLPLFLLSERFNLRWAGNVSFSVLMVYVAIAVASLVAQFRVDDYAKFFGLVATIIGIAGSIIGAALGLKKLFGKPGSE